MFNKRVTHVSYGSMDNTKKWKLSSVHRQLVLISVSLRLMFTSSYALWLFFCFVFFRLFFFSGKFRLPRTEYLSSPPFLSSLPSESSCLLLLQISPLIREIKNMSANPRLFPATFLPSIWLFAYLQVQSNFTGSNTFGTFEISSRQG